MIKCTNCGANGVKLWRKYNTMVDYQALLCANCICKVEKIDPLHIRTDEMNKWLEAVNWRAPAVFTILEENYPQQHEKLMQRIEVSIENNKDYKRTVILLGRPLNAYTVAHYAAFCLSHHMFLKSGVIAMVEVWESTWEKYISWAVELLPKD